MLTFHIEGQDIIPVPTSAPVLELARHIRDLGVGIHALRWYTEFTAYTDSAGQRLMFSAVIRKGDVGDGWGVASTVWVTADGLDEIMNFWNRVILEVVSYEN